MRKCCNDFSNDDYNLQREREREINTVSRTDKAEDGNKFEFKCG